MVNTDRDQGPILWTVNTIFTALATLAVAGRFAARRLRKLPLALDDWTICLALFWDWVLYGIFVGCRISGLGKRGDVLTNKQVATFLELLYYYQIFYFLGPPTVKMSLLFLYRRIFVSTRFVVLVHCMEVLIIIWTIIMTFLAIFNCTPISAFWTKQGQCFGIEQFAIGYAIGNLITDIAVWLLPIPRVWRVQLPMAQKVALSLIFFLGIFDWVAVLVRAVISLVLLGQEDVTWLYAKAILWSTIEVSTGIICVCLPTMRVFLKEFFHSRFARLFGGSSSKSTPHSNFSKPWLRSHHYSQIERSWLEHKSGNQHTNQISTLPVHEQSQSTPGGIHVLEEVKVELQPLKPVALGSV